MSFVTDKEELKPGLIIFRRADVQHRNWYCRIKLPKADRYKTVSLKTASASDSREIAFDKYSEMRYAIKMGVPIFNRAFSEVAKEYIAEQTCDGCGRISRHLRIGGRNRLEDNRNSGERRYRLTDHVPNG